MYEIIERNEYGVLVKNTTAVKSGVLCKYGKTGCLGVKCDPNYQYYLTDQEAAKLETEKPKSLACEIIGIQKDKINMLEETLKKIIDSQKELIDLQIENKQLKEKCKSEYQRGVEDGKIIAEHGTTMYQE